MSNSETEILQAIRQNKDAGFAILVKAYSEMIYWHIRRLVVSFHDAEDVAQETFLRVYRSLDSFRGESSLKSWIYRIATNESLRFLEKQQNERRVLSLGIDDCPPAIADEYVNYNDEAVVKFQQAIEQLPTKQRAVFNLRYYDELPYNEIAEILDISVSSAKTGYHIAKEKIKNYITN